MFSFLKKHMKSVLLGASMLLNVGQSTGVVPPAVAAKAGKVIEAASKVQLP